ncbi:MAG: hypothetical protein HY270_17185 [Deltaproteobacteria bacterium]|nr:hypothetical protein [Deltaproteobacteria bacterium]
MRRLWVVWLALLVGCTSNWKKHEIQLIEAERSSDWAHAKSEAHWLIDNAFVEAPPEERSTADEADRYLRLADIAAKSGDNKQAVEALRQALMIDSSCAGSVRTKLERLDLPARERQRVFEEFAWNIAALGPDDSGLLEYQREQAQCWSYHVREIRIRHNLVINTDHGRERRVSYDARPWRFDAESERWIQEGNWMLDAGSESEAVEGPPSGRYQAVVAADRAFYADGKVPPCHRDAWKGPYSENDTTFVATRLPRPKSDQH